MRFPSPSALKPDTALLAILAGATLVLAAACGRSYDTRDLSREGLRALAEEAFEEGDYGDAASMFLELMYRFPGSSDIDYYLHMLGSSYSRERHWSDAEFYLRRVVEDHPRSAWADDAQLELARLFWKQRRDFRRDLTPVQNALAEVEILIGSYPGSLLMDEALALEDSCRGHMARRAVFVGEFYARRGLGSAALLYFREALSYGETPSAPRALIDQADLYLDSGDTYNARVYYERALRDYDLSEDEHRRVEEGLAGLP